MTQSILMINPPVQAVSTWQMYNYAEPYPYGLLKLASVLRKQGHRLKLIDMMVYDHLEKRNMADWPHNAKQLSTKRAGSASVNDVLRPAYLLGQNMEWLKARLQEIERPDEVWVTACLTFDFETAHDVIKTVKAVFPGVFVRLGGNYPSLLPEHAATSGADAVEVGMNEAAEWEFGDLTLFDETPPVGLFNLATGCSNKCTFCVNHRYRPVLRHEPKKLAYYILKTSRELGIRHFSNWDPNVMLFPKALEEFLDLMARAKTGITMAFNMGIQPNLLSRRIAEKMLKAGVTQLTIPFETSDPDMLVRYKKPYPIHIPIEKMQMIREIGFQVGRFHSTAVFGYADERIRYLFRTYCYMVLFGAQPDFFPLTPTPTSVAFESYLEAFGDKPYDELNGYLFPLQPSKERVELYEQLIELLNQHYIDRAIPLAKRLPEDLQRAFFEELDFVESELTKRGVDLITSKPADAPIAP